MIGLLLPLLLAAGAPDAGGRDPLVVARPFREVVPRKVTKPAPLVVLIHGYGATGTSQDEYFKLSALAEERGFILALPDGVIGVRGKSSWNATDVCCAFGRGGDDVAYLVAVIHDLQARYAIDPKRIFLIGHSNGGFMAHRLACEHAELIAGIVSLAGATWKDPAKCTPSEAVSVLQVHGTNDATIKYAGALRHGAVHPGAEETVAIWAAKDACAGKLHSSGVDLDLLSDVPKDETQREAFDCAEGIGVELWRMRGGPHIPKFNPTFPGLIYDWLMAHPRK